MAAPPLIKFPSPTPAITQLLNQSDSNILFLLQRSKPKSLIPPYSLKPLTSLKNPSWLATCTSTTTHITCHSPLRPISATAVSSLPTANPERFASSDKVPKWSWRAIKAFSLAALEARKIKKSNTGTEALLMGILIEGTSLAAKYLWTSGITLLKVREEAVKLFGKPEMYFFPPERPPLTQEAQRALDWAVDHKLKSGDGGEVTTTDLLLGIWSEVEFPGHKLLAALGFNDEKAKELESLSSGPNFVDG